MEHIREAPLAPKETYGVNDQVQFKIHATGYALVPGTLRLEADVSVVDNAGDAITETTTQVLTDPYAGFHAFIESSAVSTSRQGNLENIPNNYSRLVGNHRRATLSRDDLAKGQYMAEGCSTGWSQSTLQMASVYGVPPSMSVLPYICLNRMTGPLNFSTTGAITITFRFTEDELALYGTKVANKSFQIQNPRLVYAIVPEEPQFEATNYRFADILTAQLNTRTTTLSLNMKQPTCQGFSVLFFPESSSQKGVNSVVSRKPGRLDARLYISEVETILQSNNMSYADIVQQYLESWPSMKTEGYGDSGIGAQHAVNVSYGVGRKLSPPIDISQATTQVRVDSPDFAANPWDIVILFHGITEIGTFGKKMSTS